MRVQCSDRMRRCTTTLSSLATTPAGGVALTAQRPERSIHSGAEVRAAGAELLAATERLVRMDFYTEQEVAVTAKFMGYDLLRISDGYRLTRDMDFEQEIIEADSLEMIADFLKQ
jgi:hypothetical protein